jgi:isopentenyldiphosphate isomerase
MNEDLTIFSEDGNIIGSKNRGEVHTEPLQYWHGVTQIWVFNKEHQLLCSKRSATVEGNPNKWQTYVGGHVKAGDSFEETAIKEINEEIGIDLNKDRLIFIDESKYEPAKHISKAYLVIFNLDTDKIIFNDGEISEIKWISIEEYNFLWQKNPDEWCNTLNQKKQDLIEKLF